MNKSSRLTKSINILIFIGIIGTITLAHTADAARRRSYSSETYNTQYQERERTGYQSNSVSSTQISQLQSETPALSLKVPILFGVLPSDIDDTWGDARSDGRTHEGTDIMALKDSLIVSPTRAVVTTINSGGNGGNYVFTVGPGGERYYYAHLDKFGENLKEGQVLEPGDLIGYVGNTGNAAGGPTHLHFGIYPNRDQPTNPFPRLTLEFSIKEKVDAFTKVINALPASTAEELARTTVTRYKSIFLASSASGVGSVPIVVAKVLAEVTPMNAASSSSARTLRSGSRGDDVKWLQTALLRANKGPLARTLTADGAFGPLTMRALIEYQTAAELAADGVLGPRSRASLSVIYPS